MNVEAKIKDERVKMVSATMGKREDPGAAKTAKPEAPPAAAKAPADAGPWTEEQDKFLAKAMEAVPKTASMKDADRWKKVAECVPGKDAKQCFERFKSLRENFKRAKASA